MTWKKRLFEFYIHSSLHVSLCFVAFYTVVSLYAGFSPSWLEIIAVGTATLVGYNIAKYIHLLYEGFPFHVPIKILTICCTIIALFAVIELGPYAVLLFGFCAVLTSLYALPEILGRSFRQIPILKLITIGLSWSVMAVVLPHLVYEPHYFKSESLFHFRNTGLSPLMLWELIEYTLFVIALCIPFEIRDLKYDSPKLRTLPQLIGTRNSKYVGFAVLLLCAAIEFTQFEESAAQSVITLIVILITAAAIWWADRFTSDYYASFFVEAIPVVWLVAYVLVMA